ncbi:hypothetical protein GCM10027594_22360 [Hymenobacter agri]
MEEIQEWLESGQDYAQGVALYEAHGRSAVLRSTLAFGETEFTRAKLVHALQQLVDAVPAAAHVRVVDTSAERVRETPKPVQVDPQRRDWFAERNHLHAQLGLVATDEQRRVMALRILELGDLISQSYDQAAGRASVLAPAGPGTPGLEQVRDEGEIRRLLANLKPQRSKLKKRPERAADLATVEADIHLLESKLKM